MSGLGKAAVADDCGSCHGSCTHVWNYAQAMPHTLSQALERTLREQELERSMDKRGHVNFRAALPDGPTPHEKHAAADGQLGGLMKLYRDWQISGDIAWLARLYPAARRGLEYCIRTWDPDRLGGLFEPHHNTYDIEFWGPDGMCGSIYLGALCAMSEMARALGHKKDAGQYAALGTRAADHLEKGVVQRRILRAARAVEGIARRLLSTPGQQARGPTRDSAEMLRLAEKGKAQNINTAAGASPTGSSARGWRDLFTASSRRWIAGRCAKTSAPSTATISAAACASTPTASGLATRLAANPACCCVRGRKRRQAHPAIRVQRRGMDRDRVSGGLAPDRRGLSRRRGWRSCRAVRSRYDGQRAQSVERVRVRQLLRPRDGQLCVVGGVEWLPLLGRGTHAVVRPGAGDRAGERRSRRFFRRRRAYGTIRMDARALTVTVLEGELAIDRVFRAFRPTHCRAHGH